MQCPVCSKDIQDGSKICPNCSADLSRWHPKQETEGPAKAAVILKQEEVVSLRSRIRPYTPYLAFAVAIIIFGVLLYAGSRMYLSYYLAKNAPVPQDNAGEGGFQLYGLSLSSAGFAQALQEYEQSAAAMNIAARKDEAGAAFLSGAEKALALNLEEMEKAGLTPEVSPQTAEETEKFRAGTFCCKCDGVHGTEYLTSLPPASTDYASCWTGRAAETRPVKAAKKKNVQEAPVYQWIRTSWLPELKRWSPWTPAQLSAGAEKYAEMNSIAADQAKAGLETAAAQGTPEEASAKLFEIYRPRFTREGALAAAGLSSSLSNVQAGTEQAPR